MAEPIPINQNSPEPEKEKPLVPVCPHCGNDPANANCLEFNAPLNNGLTVKSLVFFCANVKCRKVLWAVPLGVEKPRIIGLDRHNGFDPTALKM